MAADSGWVSGKTPEKSFAMSISDSVSYIVSKFPTGCAGPRFACCADRKLWGARTREQLMLGPRRWPRWWGQVPGV